MFILSEEYVNNLNELFQRSGMSTLELLRGLGYDLIDTPDGERCNVVDAEEGIGISQTEYHSCGTGCNHWLDDPIFK